MTNINNHFEKRLYKYARHTGYIKGSLENIILFDDNIDSIKEKLKDILDKDAKFDREMYGTKND